jgi:drug/metabolite transporter (DMT)-like permease
MLALVLTIVFSVLLLVNFRAHAKFNIDTRIAILVCFLTGYLHQMDSIPFHWPSMGYSLGILGIGIGFVITFLLSGYSTVKNGMAPTSLANNISLVIPVMVNLFIWKTGGDLTFSVITGLVLSFAAIYFCSPSGSGSVQKPVVWALVAVFVAYGITNTAFNYLNAAIVQQVGGSISFTLMLLLGSMATSALVLVYWTITGGVTWSLRSVLAAIPLGLPNFFSFYFLLKALDAYGQNGAVVLTIYNLGVILLSAVTALVFFKEKLTNKQWVGIGLGCAGIALIIL